MKLLKRWRQYLFLLPFLITFITFTIYPFIKSLVYSFYKFNLKDFKFIGLGNYSKILNNTLFWKSVLNSFYFVIGIVPLTIIISIILAAMIIKIKGRLRTTYMSIFYLPEVTSVITYVLTWKLVLDYRYGILNDLANTFRIKDINWLSNPGTAIPALIIMIIYGSLGTPIILYMAAMSSIPEDYYEVARLDGATNWQMLWKITFPLIMPTTLYLMIKMTIGVFQIYTLIYLMTGGGPFYKTTTMAYFMIREAFQNSNYGMASAVGVIFLFIISGFAILQYRYFSKEIEY